MFYQLLQSFQIFVVFLYCYQLVFLHFQFGIISFKKSDKGQNGLVVDMAVVIEHGYPVKPLMQQVQKSVRNEIEYITGMSIERMSIKVKNIIETKRKIVKV